MCSEIVAKKDTFKADHTNHIFFWEHQLSLCFVFLSFKKVSKLLHSFLTAAHLNLMSQHTSKEKHPLSQAIRHEGK